MSFTLDLGSLLAFAASILLIWFAGVIVGLIIVAGLDARNGRTSPVEEWVAYVLAWPALCVIAPICYFFGCVYVIVRRFVRIWKA